MLNMPTEKEMRTFYLSASVLGFSIIAIVFLAFGYTIIFYVVAILAIIVGYYFARSLPEQKLGQAPKKEKVRRK